MYQCILDVLITVCVCACGVCRCGCSTLNLHPTSNRSRSTMGLRWNTSTLAAFATSEPLMAESTLLVPSVPIVASIGWKEPFVPEISYVCVCARSLPRSKSTDAATSCTYSRQPQRYYVLCMASTSTRTIIGYVNGTTRSGYVATRTD
jgi:hypothetical protein